MASMGDMLKLMQGGQDRTGFADMADQYAFTKPDRSSEERLALLKAAMEAGQGGEESGQEGGGEEIGNQEGGFDFGKALDIFSKVVDPTGITEGNPVNPFRSDEEIKSEGYNLGNFVPKLFNGDFFRPDEDHVPMGMYDGGRVEMQQGGMPGGMAMPGLLGVASGSSGNLFDNYTPNPSSVPGPNYGTTAAPNYNTYQAPQLTSLASPYSGAQFGDIGDYLGGPDPYAVAYNPYVDMGGSAYDNYGLGMTQEDIDKVFADTDKFSLVAQEAKKKAAEEAAAAAKKKQERRGDGRGDRDFGRERHMRDVARANRDVSEGGNRGGPGDSSAPGGSAAAGGNRGGAPGARS